MSGLNTISEYTKFITFLLLIFQIINMYLVYMELSVSPVYVSYVSSTCLNTVKLKVKMNKLRKTDDVCLIQNGQH